MAADKFRPNKGGESWRKGKTVTMQDIQRFHTKQKVNRETEWNAKLSDLLLEQSVGMFKRVLRREMIIMT